MHLTGGSTDLAQQWQHIWLEQDEAVVAPVRAVVAVIQPAVVMIMTSHDSIACSYNTTHV